MTKIVKYHLPCLNPECGSSDAMNIHEGGDGHCWSCGGNFTKKQVQEGGIDMAEERKPTPNMVRTLPLEDIEQLKSPAFRARGISKEVCEFFGVKASFNSEGKINCHYYPYPNGYRARRLPKGFSWVGSAGGVCGIDKFAPGGKRLVITTGELDMLAVAEASRARYKGKIYPVITFGTDKDVNELLHVRDFVRSFQEVVLLFDQDTSGKDAEAKAIRLVGIDKVKIGKVSRKDPNDVLIHDGPEAVMEAIFNAQSYVPGGILGKDELWTMLEEYNSIPSILFPDCLGGVNGKTKGKRYGDITLFISGTGSGKSTLLREDMLHTLEVTEDKIGILAFEEGPAETARKLAGMAIKRNPANEELSLEDLRPGFDEVFGDDRVIVLDHQGSLSDESVMDKIEYLCLAGCKHLYIDHITLLAAEGVEGLVGNEAQDKIMSFLLKIVKRYPVWIGLISHLRKSQTGGVSFEEGRLPSMDDIRGSGSVKQVSMDIIAFARNMKAESDVIRNIIKMEVLKCRFTGLTGPVDGARYDFETGRLEFAERLKGPTEDDAFTEENEHEE